MKNLLIKSILLFVALTAFARAGVLEIVITEGIDTARPIAVVPFQWKGEGEAPSEITDVIAADLMRSGKFNPIPA
ncbi:Tol-Pal system protein TolB, partial [Psychrobacter sp. SIMBA_152]